MESFVEGHHKGGLAIQHTAQSFFLDRVFEAYKHRTVIDGKDLLRGKLCFFNFGCKGTARFEDYFVKNIFLAAIRQHIVSKKFQRL